MARLFIILALFFFTLSSYATENYIVLTQKENFNLIKKEEKVYQKFLENNQMIMALNVKDKFEILTENYENYYLLKVGPFQNSDAMAIIYFEVKSLFPAAFVVEVDMTKAAKKVVYTQSKFEQVQKSQNPKEYSQEEEQSLLFALFGLGAVGLIALFLSSEKIKNLQKEHLKIQAKQESLNQMQHKSLAAMGENIHNIAKEAVETTNEFVKKIKETPLNSEIERVILSEMKLLDTTGDLIEFLRLKSKKIEIIREEFKFVNMLNDVSGYLTNSFKESSIELTFDIDNNIPYIIIGDTLNLSKILSSLIEFSMHNSSNEVILKVTKSSIFTTDTTLNFLVQTDMKLNVADNEILFNSEYNEETKRFEGLGLFIAKELSLLMDGDLIARNRKDHSVEFVLTLPYHSAKNTDLKYRRELDKHLRGKSVLIVDNNLNAALATEKIFSDFKYNVEILPVDSLTKKYDFSPYNIVVIDERLLSDNVIKQLDKCQNMTDCKVIFLGTLFKESVHDLENKISSLALRKPLTQDRVFDALSELYNPQLKKVLGDSVQERDKIGTLKIYKEAFKDTTDITLHSFSEFNGSNLLLVEDNFINQRVITSILGKSGMKISIANNGEEALSTLSSKQKFDLVLMDINMPVMDGYTAAKQIRKDKRYDTLPIVSLTALTSANEVNKVFTSGMNGYLAKPIRKEKLFTAFSMFITHLDVAELLSVSDESKILELDGLDINEGILQTGGNYMFYIEVLKEFKDAYGSSADQFEKLVSEYRFEQVRMLCLDVKGLCGAIGAHNMHDLVIEIHQRLVFKKFELIPTYVETYRDELFKLNRALDTYIDTIG